MLSCRLTVWLLLALLAWVAGCASSHEPDVCEAFLATDPERAACLEPVSGSGLDGGRRDRMRDGGRERGEPEDDGVALAGEDDGPCRRGSMRKCLCSSGAYRDQVCAAEGRWEACACGSAPTLRFGDGGALFDASSSLPQAPLDGGPRRGR
jgi:hypothetical protein